MSSARAGGEKTEFISIWFGGNALDNRELMENGLRECDGVIVVYGQAKDSWVDRQLLECRKSRAFRDRPFAALGIFQGPMLRVQSRRSTSTSMAWRTTIAAALRATQA